MKKIFLFLLKKYSRTEEGRLIILSELEDRVSEEYSEQSTFGNVYNFFIEFIISNKTINRAVKSNDEESLTMIENNLHNAYEPGIAFIEEILKKKKDEL